MTVLFTNGARMNHYQLKQNKMNKTTSALLGPIYLRELTRTGSPAAFVVMGRGIEPQER
ncbi:MAG: hypothetical protein R3B93_16970 [Bacteroidia bacterium]